MKSNNMLIGVKCKIQPTLNLLGYTESQIILTSIRDVRNKATHKYICAKAKLIHK